jgi:hypothetical protein
MAELLNGSHFNYILLGSPDDANLLVRVVLVAKTADTPTQPVVASNNQTPAPIAANAGADAPDAADTDDDASDETSDGTAEAEQLAAPAEQPGVKTPQQMLQEMQQRQLQGQQQPGQLPTFPRGPGGALPPGQTPAQPDQQ